jgi:hypothetical protein
MWSGLDMTGRFRITIASASPHVFNMRTRGLTVRKIVIGVSRLLQVQFKVASRLLQLQDLLSSRLFWYYMDGPSDIRGVEEFS